MPLTQKICQSSQFDDAITLSCPNHIFVCFPSKISDPNFSQHTFLVAQTSYAQNTINNELITWRRGVVVITAAQLYSAKSELKFYTCSDPARGVLEISDGVDL